MYQEHIVNSMEQINDNMDITTSIISNHCDAFLIRGDSSNADMYYATQFFAPDPFLYVQTKEGKEILMISSMESPRAALESRVQIIKTPEDYDYRSKASLTKDPEQAYCQCIAQLLQNEGVKHVQVPRDFPLYIAQSLKESGFSVIPFKSPFIKKRARKNPEEIEKIRQTQKACESAMATAIGMVKEAQDKEGILYFEDRPLTSERLRMAIDLKLLEYGCEARDTITACGKNAANPHWAGEGQITTSEAIVIDIFPHSKTTGYFADMTRTVIRGEPPEKLKDMYDAVRAAQQAGLEMLRPGVLCSDVHKKVCYVLEEKGYDTICSGAKVGFIHSTGHGVGLEVHEQPPVANAEVELEEGNVITIEPGLYYPDIGGIRLEDMVVITEDGYENLTKMEKEFVV